MLSKQQTRSGLRHLAGIEVAQAAAHLPRKLRRAMAKRIMKETILRLKNVH
jgi:hypothetical protein